jgi:heme/copper-type cytochrome/quinol oxidase subunit 4
MRLTGLAAIETILALWFIAFLMYLALHFVIKNKGKREFAEAWLAVFVACIVIIGVQLISKSCR